MSAVQAPPSPYKGLASFAEEGLDPILFFGREREIEVIVANLIASRLTILYGPSGEGKTSVLSAGVAPRLRQQDAEVVVVSAWSTAGVLDTPASEGQRYLILDQFEEYFLYHDADGPLTEVAEVLRDREARTNVLISVREDALAQLDAFKGRIPGLFANALRLDRLDRSAGRRAITGPLERYRELATPAGPSRVEPALVEELLDSVAVGRIQLGSAGRGGATTSEDGERIEAPFLQLVLERLWTVERDRNSDGLRLETLRGLGGARRIVEEHLERAMAGLSDQDKDAAAAIYNHLVTPSGTKIAHRARDLARYAAVEEAEATRVLGHLAGERIVRAADDGAGGPQYEIFHDVLADAVLGWRARHEGDRRIEAARREAQARHRRLLAIAAAALVAVAVLAGVAIYALNQRGAARENAREARAGELVALAAAALPTDPERSLELALGASRIGRSAAVEDMLRTTLLSLRARDVIPLDLSGEVTIGPGGRLAAVGTDEVRLARTAGSDPQVLRHPKAASAAFSADGTRLVTTGDDGTARLWASDGRLLRSWSHTGLVSEAAFSRDGRRLLTVSRGRIVRVFDLRSGRETGGFTQPSDILAARFSPSGRLIATGGSDDAARLWDARSGRLRQRFEGHLGRVGDVAFSRDGGLLATGSTDGTARVWEVGGTASVTMPGHEGFVSRVEFSPDGSLLATASRDRRARIFEVSSPTLRAAMPGETEALTDIEWSRDGATLTTSSDGTLRSWDARRFPVPSPVRRHSGAVLDLRFSDDGRILSSTERQDDPRLARKTALVEALSAEGALSAQALSPDGRLAVSGHEDGSIWLWDAETGKKTGSLESHRGPVTSATFSPDGRSVVTTAADHNARLSGVAGRGQVWVLSHSGSVNDASFSADGRWVALAGPGEAGLVEARTGERVLRLDGRDRLLTAIAFSPTGWRIATGGVSGTVRAYDCRVCGGIDELVAVGESRLARLR